MRKSPIRRERIALDDIIAEHEPEYLDNMRDVINALRLALDGLACELEKRQDEIEHRLNYLEERGK